MCIRLALLDSIAAGVHALTGRSGQEVGDMFTLDMDVSVNGTARCMDDIARTGDTIEGRGLHTYVQIKKYYDL
jgi:hypothetical protein